MRDYRCFFLDGENHIRDVEVFNGADENAAIRQAQRLLAQRDYHSGFEVWQGARLITSGRRGDLRPNG
jgi:hypothetical protein